MYVCQRVCVCVCTCMQLQYYPAYAVSYLAKVCPKVDEDREVGGVRVSATSEWLAAARR